jgi:hypothetical protein
MEADKRENWLRLRPRDIHYRRPLHLNVSCGMMSFTGYITLHQSKIAKRTLDS